MAKQTRKSISLKGTTYDQLKAFCERADISMSGFLEDRIAQFFNDELPKVMGKPEKGPIKFLSTKELHQATRYFTF